MNGHQLIYDRMGFSVAEYDTYPGQPNTCDVIDGDGMTVATAVSREWADAISFALNRAGVEEP